MDKVKFNIGFQYLSDEYGLLPFIDIKYIDDDGAAQFIKEINSKKI